ncbi:MAG: TolC family protein [Bdellovibrionales bacterium]|nr:TolC family protein [Bdellovibrionales bacterium]
MALHIFSLSTFFFLPAALAQSVSSPTGRPLSFDQAYAAALAHSETLSIQTELVTQAEEHYSQAFGSALPNVSASASYLRQQSPANLAGSSSTIADQPVVKVGATQPLFRGLREFAAIRQTDQLTKSQRESKRAASRTLYGDVADAFYGVLSQERDIANIDTEIASYDKRIQELDGRVRIGRSRPSEVLSVKSAKASLVSQREQLQGQLQRQREALAFLTGLPTIISLDTSTLEPLWTNPKTLAAPAAIEALLPRIEERPDVKAAVARYAAADESVAIAKGAHWPSADLAANYYFKRPGSLDEIHWDVGVALTLPLYAGGTIQSKVRESASQRAQAQLELTRLRRQAETDVRSLRSDAESERVRIGTLQDALTLAERNYREQLRDYQLGLVTNIDVLQALSTFQESRRSLDRAVSAYPALLLKLDIAAGISLPNEPQGG